MHKKVSLLSAAVVSLAVLCASSNASAAHYGVAYAELPSEMDLHIFLGDPNEFGLYLTTVGPFTLSGSINADVSVDGNGDGTLTINSTNLKIDDFVETINLGVGLVDVSMLGVKLELISTPIPVVGNVWDIDSNQPDDISLALTTGKILLQGIVLGNEIDEEIDLGTDPLTIDMDSLLGFGIGGIATATDISIIIPAIDLAVDEEMGIYGRFEGAVYLAVPEPSTYVLFAMGLMGMIPALRRRLRK